MQQSIYYCQRNSKDKYIELGSSKFLQHLKDSKAEQVLLFIHGYSNLPEPDIFPRATKLQKLFDNKKKGLVEVVSVIWPCDNDVGIVKDYWDDQKAADASGFSFARVLQKFEVWRGSDPNIEVPRLAGLRPSSTGMSPVTLV